MSADDFWKRRYDELRARWNAAVLNPDAMRRDRDLYLSKTVALRAENHQLREDVRDLLDALSDDHYGIGTPSPLVAEAIRMMLAAVGEE